MKIVIIGERGTIASKLVNLLQQNCIDVVSASLDDGVNTVTGEGLDEVVEDAEVVVDLSDAPTYEDRTALEFFETSARHIIAAEVKAGVQHHVALSVVGADRLQESGYFRAKLAQEDLIRESLIPYTILRSTQFFDFLRGIANSVTGEEMVCVPPALVQPIAPDDVASTLMEITLSAPANAIIEVAGPERVSLAGLVQWFLYETGDMRAVLVDGNARYYGAVLHEGSLIPGDNPRIGSQSFEEWLSTARVKAFTPKAVRTVEVVE